MSPNFAGGVDRKSTRLNSSHTVIYTLSLHDALPILPALDLYDEEWPIWTHAEVTPPAKFVHNESELRGRRRSEEHTSELQSHSDLHSFPTRRSSDLAGARPLRRGVADLDPRRGDAAREVRTQ